MTDPSPSVGFLPTSQVQELIQSLVKAVRAIGLYLPNNPIYKQSIDRVREHFGPIWAGAGQIALQIGETEIHWEEEVVYSHLSKSESFAWDLYKDGLRSITLRPGFEDDELTSFLTVVAQARTLPADASDDLLTLLWEQDFQYVEYEHFELATGDPVEEVGDGVRATPEQVQEAVEEEVPERPEGLVSMDDFDSTLYFLEQAEISQLRDEITMEYEQDLKLNVMYILFDLFELESDPAVRTEVQDIVGQFVPYLLASGDYTAVAALLRESHVALERVQDLDEVHRKGFQELFDRLSSPETLGQLLQAIDEAPTVPTSEELGALFSEMRSESLEILLAWTRRLGRPEVKQVIVEATERLAREHTETLVKILGAGDEDVVLSGAEVAGRLKLQRAVGGLGGLLRREEESVRLAAINALAAIATPGALQAMVEAIHDDARDVRVAAVRALGEKGFRNAFDPIAEAAMGKQVRASDLTEKMTFFEAYGRLGGPGAASTLIPLLTGKGLLRKKADPEVRACVAMALGRIGSAEATDALNKVADDKDPLVRNAVHKALREAGG